MAWHQNNPKRRKTNKGKQRPLCLPKRRTWKEEEDDNDADPEWCERWQKECIYIGLNAIGIDHVRFAKVLSGNVFMTVRVSLTSLSSQVAVHDILHCHVFQLLFGFFQGWPDAACHGRSIFSGLRAPSEGV